MPICKNCAWYREANGHNNPVQLLAGLANSAHSDVAKKLDTLETKESEKLEAERQEVMLKETEAMHHLSKIGGNFDTFEVPEDTTPEQLRQAQDAFPILFEGEPTCVAHCVAPFPGRTGQNVWSIPTLRNWAQRCKSFKPSPPRRDCSQCVHYSPSTRDAEDAAEITDLLRHLGGPGKDANNILNEEISRKQSLVGPEKACQLEQAYSGNGNLRSRQSYLPYCLERHGVPELLNRFADCKSFAARKAAPPVSPRPAPQPAVRAHVIPSRGPAPAAPPAPATTGLQPMPSRPLNAGRATGLEQSGVRLFGGGSSIPSSHEPVFETAISSGTQAVRQFLVEKLALEAPADVENECPDECPPLTRDMLQRSLAAAAVAYGRPLPRTEQDAYVRFVQDAWQQNETQAIEAQLALMAEGGAIRQSQARRHLEAFISACGLGHKSGRR